MCIKRQQTIIKFVMYMKFDKVIISTNIMLVHAIYDTCQYSMQHFFEFDSVQFVIGELVCMASDYTRTHSTWYSSVAILETTEMPLRKREWTSPVTILYFIQEKEGKYDMVILMRKKKIAEMQMCQWFWLLHIETTGKTVNSKVQYK